MCAVTFSRMIGLAIMFDSDRCVTVNVSFTVELCV